MTEINVLFTASNETFEYGSKTEKDETQINQNLSLIDAVHSLFCYSIPFMKWQQICVLEGLLSTELKEHIEFFNLFIPNVEQCPNIL